MILRLATRLALSAVITLGCQSIAGVEDVTFTGESSNCDDYCKTLMDACPGDVAVYDDEETCRRVCALFKPGTASKPQGNTQACRAAQADVAYSFKDDFSENRTNCAAAGPGGGDKCTQHPDLPDCEGYCTIYMQACTSQTMMWGFDNFEQCTARCAAFPFNGSYAISQAKSGDTLACRLYHATLALEDPDNNCTSAGLRPSGACAGSGEPSCDDYCRVNDVACQGQYKVYESIRQCKAVCEATVKGSRADSGGQDTVGCRSYHSYFALMGQPSPHCSHSGPVGDGVCSNNGKEHPNCDAFCRLLEFGCADGFSSAYGKDHDACVDDCEKLDDAKVEGGNLYSIEKGEMGNTLKCRTLHVAEAVTDPKSVDARGYCGAAFGESPCN